MKLTTPEKINIVMSPQINANGLDCLQKVIEQDGIVLCTPAGLRKRAQRASKCNMPMKSVFTLPKKIDISDTAEQVERMDAETVACLVTRHERPSAKQVRVNFAEHVQSKYVVSLRDCYILPDKRVNERVALFDQVASAAAVPQYKHGELHADTLVDSVLHSAAHPWMTLRQFTDKSAHVHAETAGWIKIKRSIQRFFSDAWLGAVGFFKKEEKKIELIANESAEEVISEVRNQRVSFVKTLAGFFVLAAVMTLPAQALVVYRSVSQQKNAIKQQSEEAVNFLAQISGDMQISDSRQNLEIASGKFQTAERLLDESKTLALGAAAFVPSKYRSAKALLEVGDKMTQAGQLLAVGLSKVFDDKSRGLIERVDIMGAYAKGALPLLTDAEMVANSVDMTIVPDEHKAEMQILPEKLRQAKEAVREFASLANAMSIFLGKDGLRDYLLVFQNNSELRPSGGFIGSLAEIRMNKGEVESLYVPKGGSYDLKGLLTKRVQSPRPLQLINPLWQFQDANWFADFPKTAEKLRWFWSKSGQPTLDGVVAVNATFMQRLLKITGPIEMPEYGKTIDADNFMLETQKAVELEYDKTENTPKKFIGDLFAELMDRIKNLSKNQWITLAAETSDALDTKEIQIAMFDPKDEELIKRFNWGGEFKKTVGDTLTIVGANIAGQKTDMVVKEEVLHTVTVQDDGSIIDTLNIHRTHGGIKGDLFSGVRNVQYLRVYVPKGAELISAEGFDPPKESLFKKPLETDDKDADLESVELTAKPAMGTVWTAVEDERTVFGGWLQLDPGKSQEVKLVYRLPFTVTDILAALNESPEAATDLNARGAYMILLENQSGTSRQIKQQIITGPAWNLVWSRPAVKIAADTSNEQAAGWEGLWDRDRTVAAFFSLTSQTKHEKE